MTKNNNSNDGASEKQERPKFLFYRSFKEAIDQLPEEERLAVYDAIARFALDNEETEFKRGTGACIVWTCIAPVLRKDFILWSNGQKGGCPKGTKKPSMVGNRNAAKATAGESENQTNQNEEQNQNKTKTKPKQNQPLSIDNRTIDNRTEEKSEKRELFSPTHLPTEGRLRNFLIWLKEEYPELCKTKMVRNGITEENFTKLLQMLPPTASGHQATEPLQDVMAAMDNDPKKVRDKTNFYTTTKNWLTRQLIPYRP